MIRRLAVLASLLALAAPAAGQPRSAPVKMTLHPVAEPVPALKYHLLPEVQDTSPGNAALHYYRSFSPEWWGWMQSQKDLSEKTDEWLHAPLEELRKGPEAAQARWVLGSKMLREVDLAARREYCDWEFTERLRKEGPALLLPDIQGMRRLATFLALRARLEMADGHYDKAAYTLQTGFAMARHVADAPILINALVGIAIANLMADQLETFIQAADSPNLYWALTDLPRPFISLRRPLQGDKLMTAAMLPGLKDIETVTLSPQEILARVDTAAEHVREEFHLAQSKWELRFYLTGLVIQAYPEAKRFLIRQGRKPEQVEAMPALQVVLLYSLFQLDRLRDDLDRWMSLPYWEAHAGIERAEREIQGARKGLGEGLPFASFGLFGVGNVALVPARLDRRIAALRCVEALRLYAAAHDGQLPDKLTDVTDVPIPIDPVTGKEFEYHAEGGRATLHAPPPPGQPPVSGYALTYEITLAR